MKLALLLTTASLLAAQQPLSFEVASIKQNTSGEDGWYPNVGRIGAAEYTNFPLRRLIQLAYRVPDLEFSGPQWLDSVRFDLKVKLPEGAKNEQIPEMLQTLLADRFKLQIHREQKEVPGYLLLVDKKALLIQPVDPGPSGKASGPSVAQITRGTMADFALVLQNSLSRPVKDMTGVDGLYTIKLRWLPEGPLPADTSNLANTVFDALQTLGLRLQVQKLPVEMLIVDHAERTPTPN